MNYIYLTNKSIEQTKKDIESKKIILNTLDSDIIWIINKEDAIQTEERIKAKAAKIH